MDGTRGGRLAALGWPCGFRKPVQGLGPSACAGSAATGVGFRDLAVLSASRSIRNTDDTSG